MKSWQGLTAAVLLSVVISISITGNAQNVGIGTANPTALLHAVSSGIDEAPLFLLQNLDGSHRLVLFGGRENDPNPFIQVSATDPLRFATDENGFRELMRITPNGNLGIGTSSPHASLHLGNITSNRRLILFENGDNDHQYYGFGINSSTLRYQVNGTTANHIFYAATNASTSNQLMRIQGNGNVGIGVAAADERLHVNGNIRVADGADIFGLDQVVGFNGLRFSGDPNDGVDMIISASGRFGFRVGVAPNVTSRLRSNSDDLLATVIEDNAGSVIFGIGQAGFMGVNTLYSNVSSNVRGVEGHANFLRVENPAGAALFVVNGAGNVSVANTLSKGGGSFKIDHPLDPANKYLYHSFVESPDMMNVYNGNINTDASGTAVVTMPEWFDALNRDFRYQLTVMGQFAQAIVSDKMKQNQFTIKTDKPDVEVSWQVTGIRKDAWANKNRIPVEEAKESAERGRYLHPEAFGRKPSESVGKAKLMAVPELKVADQ